MKLIFLFCAILLLQCSIDAQRHNLLFESSFEGSNHTYLNGFDNSQHCCDSSVTRTTLSARSGSSAMRLEVNASDPLTSSSIRAEVTVPTVTDTGERWYAASFFLKDWVTDSSPQSLIQWHPNSPGGSSVLTIQSHANEFKVVYGDPNGTQHFITNSILGAPQSNAWTDFVFHVKWDTTTNGFIHVWKNGVLAYSITGIRTEWGTGQYLKVGINHFGWASSYIDAVTKRVFYVDDVRIGNANATYNDVAPSPIKHPLLFESSFEGSDDHYLDSFENDQHCCSYSVQRDTARARAGHNSVRFEVRNDDDQVSGSIRSQLTLPAITDSAERWYGLSTYLQDWIDDESPHSILEWQPSSNGGASFLSLQAHAGVLQVVHGNNDEGFHYESNSVLGSPASDAWTDFVFHVKWDTTSNGFIQVWKNGVLAYDTGGIRTQWGEGQYIKYGINHYGWSIPVNDTAVKRVMYLDEIRVGDQTASYADVAPGSGAGCVSPTATLATTNTCDGQPYFVKLNSATGTGPYQLFVNKATYNNVQVGDTLFGITPQSQSLFDTPTGINEYDENPVELGFKFRSQHAGFITGIRFYSYSSPTGTFTGNLWRVNGELLATAPFSNVNSGGWHQVIFDQPVLIDADTTYVASYFTSDGQYTATSNGLMYEQSNGSLASLSGLASGGNGLYGYGDSSVFPTNSYNDANYWVDVIFKTPVDTFYLATVTNASGCTASGSLQVLKVEPELCESARTSVQPRKITPLELTKINDRAGLALEQNFPNPVRSGEQTTIGYTLETTAVVSLAIYDVNGRIVKMIPQGRRLAGNYQVVVKGRSLQPGIYYYQLQVGARKLSKKMVIQ